MNYVVGFAFDHQTHQVLLIKKLRPAWQVNYLNGIGGKIEPGETIFQAMLRKFHEEAGTIVPEPYWEHFCDLVANGNKVSFLATDVIVFTTQITDEELIRVDYNNLPNNVIDNLRWLIPMAMSRVSVIAKVKEQ